MSRRARLLNWWLRHVEKPALARMGVDDLDRVRRRFEFQARLLFPLPRGLARRWTTRAGLPASRSGRRRDAPALPAWRRLCLRQPAHPQGPCRAAGGAHRPRRGSARLSPGAGASLSPPRPRRFRALPTNGRARPGDPCRGQRRRRARPGASGAGLRRARPAAAARDAVAVAVDGPDPVGRRALPPTKTPRCCCPSAGSPSRATNTSRAPIPPTRSPARFSPRFPAPGRCMSGSATREILRDDSRRLVERLRAQGVDVHLTEEPDLVHAWPLFPGWLLPEAETTLDQMAEAVRAAL